MQVTRNDNLIEMIAGQVRGKAKKTAGSSRNDPKHPRPKHRGWKRQDGYIVSKGTMLVTQRTPRFHPGLNVSCSFSATHFTHETLIGFMNIFQGWIWQKWHVIRI